MYFRALRLSVARRPKRFAIAVLAVTVGVGMAVALVSVSLTLGDRLGETARQYGANLMVLPAGADTPLEVAGTDLSAMLDAGALPDSAIAVVRGFRWRNNVVGLAPQSFEAGTVRRSNTPPGAALRVAVVGTWFHRTIDERGPVGMTSIAPWWSVEGRLPAEPQVAGDPVDALVGRALAARLGIRAGDALTLAIEDDDAAARPLDARVSGILDAGGFEDDQLYVTSEALAAAVATTSAGAPAFDRVLLSMMLVPGETPPMPDPSKDLAAFERWSCRPYAGTVARELGQALPGSTVRPVADLVRGEGRVVGRLNLLMILLTGAALAAAALGVMSTMVASVVDRTHEIALLRALGATHSGVGGLFAGEILLVAILGGILGAFLGFALAQMIGRGAFGIAVPPQPLLVPAAVALAALVCTAGAWFPLRRISAIDPARALRPGA